MKITVLDGYTMNPGDMSWDELGKLGELTVYDRTAPEEVVERSKDSEIILTNKVVITKDIIDQLPHLIYIGVLATGYNVVDIKYAREKGIDVTNIPAYSTDSVVQMVFAHLLNVTNNVAHYVEENRKGRWADSVDFSYLDSPLHELASLSMGIIGLGNIGMKVAKVATAFGMKVMAVTSKSQDALPEGVTKAASMDDMLSSVDVVSLNCPLTESTREVINAQNIAKMKRGAIVVNTGRGPLVNEQDVADALKSGQLSAFCADVLTVEPALKDNPLLTAPNVYLTPHIAWASVEARQRLMAIEVENIRSFIAGKPTNVIN